MQSRRAMKSDPRSRTPGRRPRRAATPAAALLAVLAAALLSAPPAAAHHILGIPHYRYGEEYPQIPFMEVVAQVGEMELVFTHFPGFPSPGERVRFKLYVRNRRTGEAFHDDLTARIVHHRFWSSDRTVAEPFTIRTGTGPESHDYKFFFTFEEAEAYEIRVRFPTGSGEEIIPFPVIIGKTDDRPLIFGAAGILLASVIAVGAVKRRRGRASSPGPAAREPGSGRRRSGEAGA